MGVRGVVAARTDFSSPYWVGTRRCHAARNGVNAIVVEMTGDDAHVISVWIMSPS
jgi:hypothetical protein